MDEGQDANNTPVDLIKQGAPQNYTLGTSCATTLGTGLS
jgi:hypothetical protein